jgi:exodeoxyribonuclease VII large subunit
MSGRLQSLSPLAVLSRGYSITRLLPERKILCGVEGVREGDEVEVILAEGRMECSVESIDCRKWNGLQKSH